MLTHLYYFQSTTNVKRCGCRHLENVLNLLRCLVLNYFLHQHAAFYFDLPISREWENYIAISAPQIAHCWHLTSFYIFLRAGLLGLQKWYIPLCKGEISLHWEVWILMSKKSMSCPNFFSAHFLHQGQKVISAALEKFKMRFLSTVDQ